MRLGSILGRLAGEATSGGARLVGDADVEIVDVHFDSRRVDPGSLFCCVTGASVDGHEHAPEAVERGAVALMVERVLDLDVPQIVVDDVRRAMALAAAAVHGDPSASLTVIGVTGTNGKTTTTHLLRSILESAGRPVRVLGTLSGARTTPEAPDLQRMLAEWRDAGVELVAMEVSSHALDLHRVEGVRFAVAVFTNLGRDHLDHHRSMEEYFAAKARLFTPALSERAVVNLDSPHGRLLADVSEIPTDGYSLDEVDVVEMTVGASEFRWRGLPVLLTMGGLHNVMNALAAAHAALAIDVDEATIVAGLSAPIVVPGRFETVDAGQPFDVVVDFAHTPDALESLLDAAARGVGAGRVIVVFGCGGDRDATKRGPMGEAVARGADVVVVTADNSRGEDTRTIIDSVLAGIERVGDRRASEVIVEPDRRAAISTALRMGRVGDVVLVAGKGHETTQTIGDTVTEFDDRIVIVEEWERLGDAA